MIPDSLACPDAFVSIHRRRPEGPVSAWTPRPLLPDNAPLGSPATAPSCSRTIGTLPAGRHGTRTGKTLFVFVRRSGSWGFVQRLTVH